MIKYIKTGMPTSNHIYASNQKFQAKLEGQFQSFHACEEHGQSVNMNICILENRLQFKKKPVFEQR
jgi:hypothetical protein